MDFVERFKARKVITGNLDLVVGDFTFQVRRFSQAESGVASRRSEAMLRERGLEPTTAGRDELIGSYCCALTDIIRRHVVGFTHQPKDGSAALEYSKATCDELFDAMTDAEKVGIGAAYIITAEEDLKKTEIQMTHSSPS